MRLNGWLTPSVSLAIARTVCYVATRLGGKVAMNGQPISGRHDLRDGDVVSVGGLTLEFCLAGNMTAPLTLPDPEGGGTGPRALIDGGRRGCGAAGPVYSARLEFTPCRC